MSEVNPNYFKIPSDSLQFPLFSCADRKDPFTSFPLAIKLRGLSSICPTAVLSVRQDRFRSRCCLGLLRPMRNQFTAIILLNPCAFLVSCETSLQFVHVDSCAMRSFDYTFYLRCEFFEVNSLNASCCVVPYLELPGHLVCLGFPYLEVGSKRYQGMKGNWESILQGSLGGLCSLR